ncbi:MAG: hypothetical protein GX605_04450 [Chloroflexi bacterium]|nr:hypothetical protein [Chloroflexota bacterium]
MAVLLKFISEHAAWFYGLCLALAVALLRLTYVARRDRKQAIFTLERETASKRQLRILYLTLVLFALLGLVFAVDRYVAPALPLPMDEPTPMPTLLFIPTPSATPAPPTATPTIAPTRARPTRPAVEEGPTPTATPPPAVAVPPAQCPSAGAQISAPAHGQVVRGVVQFNGTAQVENFQYYKVEIGPGANPQGWGFLFSGQAPVAGGGLGTWDSATVSPGLYTVRLVVVDVTGNYPTPCQVSLQVER